MRSLTKKALIIVCSAIWINTLCVNAAGADSATYIYRGNNFVELQGEPGIFSTKDRVTGRFTLDCSAAHIEGTCASLPFDNYFALGAVELESMGFSAGPASLPTAEVHADVNAFYFSTDSNGKIVDWDIDLSLNDPSGLINVDTDNYVNRPIDSAAALGGGAVVLDDPGKWKKIRHPGRRSSPIFRDNNRTYGNGVGADVCVQIPSIQAERCAYLQAWEDYDVRGTFQFTGIEINYWFMRWFPEGGYRNGRRWMFCQGDLEAIKAHPNHVTLAAVLYPNGPECSSYGMIEECDASYQCDLRPWGFDDPTEVTGEWTDPINTSKAVVNREDNFYDPWSETSHRTVTHCNEKWGDLMARGGFSIASRDLPFEGIDTQGWSNYRVSSCNTNFKGK